MILGVVACGRRELSPMLLSFVGVSEQPYQNFLPSNLIDMNEQFAADTGQFTKYSENTPGTTSISNNKYTITHSGKQNDIVQQNVTNVPLPQAWVEAAFNHTVAAATGYDNIGVGLALDQNNYLWASVDSMAPEVRIQIKIGGTSTFLAGVVQAVPASFSLAMSLVGNSVCVFLDTGTGWQLITSADVSSYYDFRTAGNLTGWHPAFVSANGGGDSEWEISNFREGRFGGVGIRDMTIVTNEGGTPAYEGTNTIKFTATCPDARGVAYCGVFTLNLDTYAFEQVGVLMVQRDGKIYADLVPHIIKYPNGDRRITIGTWGNGFGGVLEILHKLETAQDLLSGSKIVSGMTALNLPGLLNANYGAYDSMMVYDSANSRWLIAYAITETTTFFGSPFYAAAAYSSDLVNWTLIGADTATQGYEGAKILRADGQYWIMVGGPAGIGTSSRVYDANMTYQGALDVVFSGSTVTQPHPMVFPYAGKQIILTFDSTPYGELFTWGDLRIYEAPRYVA